MEGPAQAAQEDIGEVSAVAHESIDGALVVKTLGREDLETERLAEKAEALRRDRVAAGYIRATFEAGLDALPTLATALLLAVGSWRVSTGAITTGQLIGFVALFGLLSWPMRFIGWSSRSCRGPSSARLLRTSHTSMVQRRACYVGRARMEI